MYVQQAIEQTAKVVFPVVASALTLVGCSGVPVSFENKVTIGTSPSPAQTISSPSIKPSGANEEIEQLATQQKSFRDAFLAAANRIDVAKVSCPSTPDTDHRFAKTSEFDRGIAETVLNVDLKMADAATVNKVRKNLNIAADYINILNVPTEMRPQGINLSIGTDSELTVTLPILGKYVSGAIVQNPGNQQPIEISVLGVTDNNGRLDARKTFNHVQAVLTQLKSSSPVPAGHTAAALGKMPDGSVPTPVLGAPSPSGSPYFAFCDGSVSRTKFQGLNP